MTPDGVLSIRPACWNRQAFAAELADARATLSEDPSVMADSPEHPVLSVLYVDTSALVALIVPEPGSAAVARWYGSATSELASAAWCRH